MKNRSCPPRAFHPLASLRAAEKFLKSNNTVMVVAVSAAGLYLIYTAVLWDRFANGMVDLFQNTLGMEYDAALRLHERTFRNHMDAIILLTLLAVFAGLFYYFLRWITRYFASISRGVDTLLQDASGEISLPRSCFLWGGDSLLQSFLALRALRFNP